MICDHCLREMSGPTPADSCVVEPVKFPDGTELPQSRGHRGGRNGRCGDCNVLLGEVHHPGCDGELCPRCGGQLITCGCLDDPDDDEDDDAA